MIPTSHNTPVNTALLSCRNLDYDKIINKVKKINVCDDNGLFINNDENRKKFLNLLNYTESNKQKKILESAIYGIFSNFGDSIYIANDYLYVGKSDYNYVILSNYPDKVSQREIERSRIIAYSLKNGNMPLTLNDNITFEGEANIKFIPAIIENNNKQYQMCITYDSTRSNSKCIKEINKLLEKVNLPLLKEINLRPKKEMEKYFYHQDCILNFSTNNVVQYFKNEDDFYKNYKKNGLLVLAKNGLQENYKNKINNLFKNIIEVDINEDLLAANMILSKSGAVCSSNISKIDEIKEFIPKVVNYIHPSHGGGGAHKCCSNVLKIDKEISIDEWISFCEYNNIYLNNNLIKGVKNELDRLY